MPQLSYDQSQNLKKSINEKFQREVNDMTIDDATFSDVKRRVKTRISELEKRIADREKEAADMRAELAEWKSLCSNPTS